MFCSSSIAVHLLRGLGAVVLLGLGLSMATDAGASLAYRLAALPLAIGAFFLMRGCPMCWLVGLFETIRAGRR